MNAFVATELSTSVDWLKTGFGKINANLLEADIGLTSVWDRVVRHDFLFARDPGTTRRRTGNNTKAWSRGCTPLWKAGCI